MDFEKKRYVMHKETFLGVKDGVTMRLQHKCSKDEVLCEENEGQLYVQDEKVNACPNCGYSIQ